MLGFIVRRCAKELGHPPTPAEFAAWANDRKDNSQSYSLFGQPISVRSAEVMLRRLCRLVTVRPDTEGGRKKE